MAAESKHPKFDKFIAAQQKKGFKITIQDHMAGQIATVAEGQYKGYCVARVEVDADGETFMPNNSFRTRKP